MGASDYSLNGGIVDSLKLEWLIFKLRNSHSLIGDENDYFKC
jgi:hypothetical protein